LLLRWPFRAVSVEREDEAVDLSFLPPLTNMPGQYRYHEVALLSDPLYALPVLA